MNGLHILGPAVSVLLTFAIMLGAALVMSGMASRIRQQTVAGRVRERRTEALLGLSRALAAAELPVARWVIDHLQPAGRGTDTLPATAALFMPIASSGGAVGVLAVRSGSPLLPDQLHLVEAFACQAAVALERSRLAGEAREVADQAEAERLRSSPPGARTSFLLSRPR